MYIAIPFIIGILFIIDAVLLFAFSGLGMTELVQDAPMISVIFILIQLPIIYFVLYKSYIQPLEQLNQSIAKFMTGVDEDVNLNPDSWNKGMNYVISFFVKSLQILKVFKQELRDGRKLRSEVEIASEMQKHVLSKTNLVIPSLEIALATAPASEVGGDSLDIIAGKNDNYYIYIGDVTGHGVPSGFVMMTVNALVSAFVSSEQSSATVLSETNRILKPRIKQNMMMTCVMLRWDDIAKTLYYTGAGHEYLLVYKAATNKVFKIKSGGVALGMVRDASKTLKEQQILFEKNDVIILYTDGITEARYRSEQNGLLFGIDRIVESIMKPPVKTAENIFRQITIDLSAFMGYKHKQYDDVTLFVARYVGSGGETLTDLPEKIDYSHLTEWNWGIHRNDEKIS
ncbi:serine/threonine-protein phosphatase [Candidatus Gracilibacteria bacterium]|nr:serine/threonine-protein phosphatase [Candidatus Gracilibacteria bacterium]